MFGFAIRPASNPWERIGIEALPIQPILHNDVLNLAPARKCREYFLYARQDRYARLGRRPDTRARFNEIRATVSYLHGSSDTNRRYR